MFDAEQFAPQGLINHYLPQPKEFHAAAANFHNLKIYLDYSQLQGLRQQSAKLYNFVTGKLMTSIHKHMSSMFKVPEPQNTSVKVN